ncbi:hypothetical protein FH969_07605 [Miniimonas arenae]|uniref:Uncharacterized protein n=1 Tax=Miniimonas arenae TaxID=676201 RepID=A0A5C5BD15_9MICO|nr:hypothetical protein [Miniimonas arenae]TNU74689.1 hypothetical protein FH969_07605 [Miniimonas arenae]
MVMPPFSIDDGRAVGPSYGLVLTRGARDAVLESLSVARFSGWVSPAPTGEEPWTVAVAEDPLGHVASERRTLSELARDLARDLAPGSGSPDDASPEHVPDGERESAETLAPEGASGRPEVICAVVRAETLLTIAAFDGEQQLVDYLSDAHAARPGDEFAWGPEGAHGGRALARLSGRPDAGEDAVELLGEELGESENESERIMALARLLGWPEWLVAVVGLPKRVAGGPPVEDWQRLRAGRSGLTGRLAARAARTVRRRDLTES